MILLIAGLLLPSFAFAQGAQAPKTLDEAKSFVIRILSGLPGAAKEVWKNEALPFLQKMWSWTKNIWSSYIWSKIEPGWQKFIGLFCKEVEKRKPEIKEEFKKEKEELKEELPKIGKSLWERFKDLLK